MITIENTYASAVVYAEEIDTGAAGLLKALCGSPLSEGCSIRVMPDVHAGRGCAIGTTIALQERIAPGLVGVDIGCGMRAVRLAEKRLDLQKLDKVVREYIPCGQSIRSKVHRFAEESGQEVLDSLLCGKHVQKEKALRSIGTLGGGNHFIEADRGEDGAYWLIVHTGSRRLGLEVAKFYQDAAFRQSPEGTPYELAWCEGELAQSYLRDMATAQAFAALNRRAIVQDILKAMKLSAADAFDTVHNYIDTKHRILRKGAVSAQAGERLLIPMNMRDGCLLCTGKGNPQWNFSAPHGAGRLMSREAARQSFTLSQFKKEMTGVYSTSISRATLDESPMAYKPMDAILQQIGPTAEVQERLRPVYNFKAGEE